MRYWVRMVKHPEFPMVAVYLGTFGYFAYYMTSGFLYGTCNVWNSLGILGVLHLNDWVATRRRKREASEQFRVDVMS